MEPNNSIGFDNQQLALDKDRRSCILALCEKGYGRDDENPSIIRFGLMVRTVSGGDGDRCFIHDTLHSGMVCRVEKAVLDAAELVVRAGLVSVIHYDGPGGLAGLETRGFASVSLAAGYICDPTRPEFMLVLCFFRSSKTGDGFG